MVGYVLLQATSEPYRWLLAGVMIPRSEPSRGVEKTPVPMSERHAPSPDQGRPTLVPETHPAAVLEFVRVEYDGGPDRCTIYPRDPDRTELTTTWLTADRGDFVDLSAFE
jgi:hypothetical protein